MTMSLLGEALLYYGPLALPALRGVLEVIETLEGISSPRLADS